MMTTRIPYLDEVWNVTTGCGDDMVSPGCLNCYARRMFGRNLWKCPECKGEGELITLLGDGVDCTACDSTGTQDFRPTFHADRLDQPLHWRKPRRVGVSFMGDLFHEGIAETDIFRAFDTMEKRQAKTVNEGWGQLTWLLLTKRPDRMKEVVRAWLKMFEWDGIESRVWPHVWLGVTVCNQAEADRLVPLLLDTPAAVRWASYEPAIGPVDFRPYLCTHDCEDFGLCQMDPAGKAECAYPKLDLIVVGGETGPGARPMQPEWALDVYRQCKAAGVPFWWKQGGPRWAENTAHLFDPDYSDMQRTHELPAVTP